MEFLAKLWGIVGGGVDDVLNKEITDKNLVARLSAGIQLAVLNTDASALGDQAANIQTEAKGESWSAEEEDKFRNPIRAQYESQGNPYYATARLWDDGVIDPADTRLVLGLGLSAAANAPIEATKFGLFRM